MRRFLIYAVPLLLLELALFGFAVELLDVEPRRGSVIRLALLEQPRVPGQLVLGTWLVEASGLIALFLLAQGRLGRWWLDGLVSGWVAWIFRGPLLVITIVVAARQPQDAWWTLAFGWWVLYSVCGLSLAILARRSGLEPWVEATGDGAGDSTEPRPESAGQAPPAELPVVTEVASAEQEEVKDEVAVESEAARVPAEEPTVESVAISDPADADLDNHDDAEPPQT